MLMGWYQRHTKETHLFSLAFVVRIVFFLLLWQWFVVLGHMPQSASNFPVNEGDSLAYHILSQNLLTHHGYSLSAAPPYVPDSFRLPGYPFFLFALQAIGFPLVFVICIQMLIGSGTVVLTYLLGRKFLSEKVAYVAALLLCIEPTTVFFSVFVMSDTLFVFSILCALYFFISRQENTKKDLPFAFIGGLILGYAVLVRVIALYLPPLFILAYSMLYRGKLRPITRSVLRHMAFLVGIIIVIAPWSLRNYSIYRTYDISATPYVNFTLYNLPLFYAYLHRVPVKDAFALYYAAPFASSSPVNSLTNKPVFNKLIHDSLQGNVLSYLKFHLVKTLPFFVTDGVRDMNRIVGLIPIPPDQTNFSDMVLQADVQGIMKYFISPNPNLWMLLVGSVPWILITFLWLFELLYVIIKRATAVWFVCFVSLFILYFALLTGPVTEHRYRMPAAPFMILLAVQGALTLRHVARTRMNKVRNNH